MKIVLSLFFLLSSLQAELIPYEESYIHFALSRGWVRQAEKAPRMGYYFKWDQPSDKLFYQVHRHRKWAQWHMKGLSGKQNTFIQQWKSDLELRITGEPIELNYDSENYILRILWEKDGGYLLSKMKLTSFGCVAFHQLCDEQSKILESEELLDGIMLSMEIPGELQFYPEDLASELINNMGGAVAFVILSILYLMFSLFQRSQMKHRRLEMLYTSRMASDR
ncbi:MAG: hypothetical protein MK132_08705 [Lentisphaerales bacterium]|nr:hypothetical protein [Lentisphaerales bacterium]